MATQHCGKTRNHGRHSWESKHRKGLRVVVDKWMCPGTAPLGTPRHKR
jgi:hypothetical protein